MNLDPLEKGKEAGKRTLNAATAVEQGADVALDSAHPDELMPNQICVV
jgi:hypothetical protein